MPLILRTNLLSKPNGNDVAIVALSTHSSIGHGRTTKNLMEVWQNLAIFSSRPISGTVEVLLTKVVTYE
jgi:hypothetical protein